MISDIFVAVLGLITITAGIWVWYIEKQSNKEKENATGINKKDEKEQSSK